MNKRILRQIVRVLKYTVSGILLQFLLTTFLSANAGANPLGELHRSPASATINLEMAGSQEVVEGAFQGIVVSGQVNDENGVGMPQATGRVLEEALKR